MRPLCLALALVGCVGAIDPPDGENAAGPGTPSSPAAPVDHPTDVLDPVRPVEPADCRAPLVGGSPLRRLSRREYNQTIRDLLGETGNPADAFSADQNLGVVTKASADDYRAAAEQLSRTVDLAKLLPCDPRQAGEDACARQFITTFGRRAFRRPLAPQEVARLERLYTEVRTPAGFSRGIRAVLQGILQSPKFLYRVEIGTPSRDRPGLHAFTGYELASRLSYTLWGTTPDETLLAAAAAGELGTAEGLAAHARRMLQSPLARGTVAEFHARWTGFDTVLGIAKDARAFPEFPALRPHMSEETRRFVEHVVFDLPPGEATLRTLLTASFSFLNDPLAKLYGVPGNGRTSVYARTALPPNQRAGLLTHAAILSAHSMEKLSAPIARAVFVRGAVLCDRPPPAPPDAPEAPDPKPGLSTRELFREHTANPACRGCHQLFDPLGWGFESYDAIGRYRTTDNGVPVDSSGEVVATRDVDGPFADGIELVGRLGASAQVSDCVVRQWFAHAYGRDPTSADACAVATLTRAFRASGGNIRELMVELIKGDAFRFTGPPPREGP